MSASPSTCSTDHRPVRTSQTNYKQQKHNTNRTTHRCTFLIARYNAKQFGSVIATWIAIMYNRVKCKRLFPRPLPRMSCYRRSRLICHQSFQGLHTNDGWNIVRVSLTSARTRCFAVYPKYLGKWLESHGGPVVWPLASQAEDRGSKPGLAPYEFFEIHVRNDIWNWHKPAKRFNYVREVPDPQ